MNAFFNKEDYTFSDLESLIKTKVPESYSLDYKSGKLFEKKTDKLKEDIIEQVTSFANKSGGIIIYGVDEDSTKQFPEKFSFIDFQKFPKEWFDQVINENIAEAIENLIIYPIFNPENSSEGVVLVKVPFSYNSPHMALDGKYHLRLNTSTREMKDVEVKNLFEKNRVPDLEISRVEISNFNLDMFYNKNQCACFQVRILIKNIGKRMERFYKLKVSVPFVFSPKGNGKLIYDLDIESQQGKSVKGGKHPIFKGEEIEMLKLHCEISRTDVLNNNSEITIELLFSGGIKTLSINPLKEKVLYNDQQWTDLQHLLQNHFGILSN